MRLLADLEQLVANLIDGLVPGEPLPLAAHQLHGVFEPALAMGKPFPTPESHGTGVAKTNPMDYTLTDANYR